MRCIGDETSPLVVNLFGAPGAGKSTGAAWLFSKLKLGGFNAEMAPEFAKDKVWEESVEVFKNQLKEYLTPKGEKKPIFNSIRPRNNHCEGPRPRFWQFPELSVLRGLFSVRMDVPDYFKEDEDDLSPPAKRTRLISPSRSPLQVPPLTRSTLWSDGKLHPAAQAR